MRQIARLVTSVEIKCNQPILEQGRYTDSAYIIFEGKVNSYKATIDANRNVQEKLVKSFSPHQCFGREAFESTKKKSKYTYMPR